MLRYMDPSVPPGVLAASTMACPCSPAQWPAGATQAQRACHKNYRQNESLYLQKLLSFPERNNSRDLQKIPSFSALCFCDYHCSHNSLRTRMHWHHTYRAYRAYRAYQIVRVKRLLEFGTINISWGINRRICVK